MWRSATARPRREKLTTRYPEASRLAAASGAARASANPTSTDGRELLTASASTHALVESLAQLQRAERPACTGAGEVQPVLQWTIPIDGRPGGKPRANRMWAAIAGEDPAIAGGTQCSQHTTIVGAEGAGCLSDLAIDDLAQRMARERELIVQLGVSKSAPVAVV